MQELCYGDFQIQAYPSNISKKRLVKSLKAILENWKKYKPIRGMIEDIFKLAKKCFLFKEFASLYEAFSQKISLFACTFGRDMVSLGINSKEKLQNIANW